MIEMPDIGEVRRMHGWDVALVAELGGLVGEPFEWGRTNCAALAAHAVDLMCGTDLMGWQAGLKLNDHRAAVLAARRTTRAVLMHVGLRRVDPPYAQRGDILLAYDGAMEYTHVCLGLHAVSSSPERGVHLVKTEDVVLYSRILEVLRCP